MERTGWQQTWVRILTTGLTITIMVLIFHFSMEDAERSDQTSGAISRTVVRLAYPDYEQMTPADRQVSYDNVQHAVRKSAHFTEYMLLGLMIRMCLESWFGSRRRMAPAAWAAGTAYAGTDELHQLLIDGRSGQWTDVLLDSGGVAAGVLIASVILHLFRSKRLQA